MMENCSVLIPRVITTISWVRGSLTLKDMILLGDYMPVDWGLIFKSIRQSKDILRPVDAEAATINMGFSEPGDNPFADYFTDVDGA